MDQIATTVGHMQQATQMTAAAAEQSASSAAELSSQSESMQSVVDHLAAMVGAD
jgi:methyl-accepting chemotaxis protein